MDEVERRFAETRARIQALLPEQMSRIDWPGEKLEAFRRERLRATLTHATERSEWHRGRLSHIDPASFRLEDLYELPVMTKTDLVEHFDAISSEPDVTRARCEETLEAGGGRLLDNEFVVMASGGTTGVRAMSVTRIDDMGATFSAGLLRFVMRWRLRSGAQGAPEPPFMIASAPGHHASNVLKRMLGEGQDRAVSVVEPIERVVAALNEADPSHIIVYSSFIPHLVDEVRAGRLHIRPKIVTPVAESFLPEHEAALAEVWDCVVISSWGATETGLLGAGTGFESGMLLLDDRVVVEPVDADGAPVPAGVRADKLLITQLTPTVLPLVRYELSDQLAVLEPATCGSSFTRVSYVRGRQDEEFKYGNVAVHAHTFRTVLSRERAISEYQVEQTPSGAHLRAVLSAGTADLDRDGIAARLVERLAHIGVADAVVEVSVVPEIARIEASSKLRRFVPLAHERNAAGAGTPTSGVGAAADA